MCLTNGRRLLRLVMALTVIAVLASCLTIGVRAGHGPTPAGWAAVNVVVRDGWPSSGPPH